MEVGFTGGENGTVDREAYASVEGGCAATGWRGCIGSNNGRNEGNGMKSEDDPRSIDWAPKKVEAIERRLNSLEEEGVSNDKIFSTHNERIGALETRVSELLDRVNELQNAIASKVRAELSEGFRDLEPEPEFSAPIGAVLGERRGDPKDYLVTRSPGGMLAAHQTKHGGIFAVGNPERGVVRDGKAVLEKVTGAAAMREEAYSRGYSAGRASVVDELQSRMAAFFDEKEIFGEWRTKIEAALLKPLQVQKPFKREIHPRLAAELGTVENSGSE